MPKSPKLLLAAMLGAMCVFFACNKNQSAPLTPPLEPAFNMAVAIPTFPSYSIHILEREYLHQKSIDNQRVGSMTLEEYIESRLMELYPDMAYEGMLEYVTGLYEQFETEYEQYMEQEALYEASIGLEPEPEEEYLPFTTLENEIEYTDMTQEEIDLFLALEEIAQSDPPVSIETLDSLLNADGGRLGRRVLPIGAVQYSIGFVPYAAFRLIQARNRAIDKSEEYYGVNNHGSGKRGDAFKHIFVSMHLRRYLSRPISAALMYLNEAYRDVNGTNNPPNREMDFHNNYIGRKSKYRHFRARRWKDRKDWGKWSRRVRDYVNNHSNGVKMEEWFDEDGDFYPTSNSVAQDEADDISSSKYIWFKEN